MTVSSATRKAGPFLGNDSSTSFPFDFKVFAKTDIAVTTVTEAGVETVLVLDSDYSVTLNPDQNANPGGSITYPISGSPLVTGSQLTITGSLSEAQPTDITNLGGFYPSVLENALDRATILIQQLRELVDRSLKFPVSDAVLIAELPTAAIRAGKSMIFDADGNVTASAVDASGIGDLQKITYVAGVDFTAGVTTTLTLPEDPVTKSNVTVIFNDNWQQQTGFEVSGTTITFDVAIPVGTTQVEVVYSVPLPIGVPSLGSVTTPRIADEAVTAEKFDPTDVTTFARTLLDDVSAALAKLTLQVEPGIFPISASVAGNAMTLTLNPCVIDFRSPTLSSGTINTRVVSSPISTVISAGSTGGTASGVYSRIYLLAIDYNGTVELAWMNAKGANALTEDTFPSTIAEGGAGGADLAASLYSTTARASIPYRIVGYVEFTQTTAGQWAAAPFVVQGASARSLGKLYGGIGTAQTWQSVTRAASTTYTNTTGQPIVLNLGGAISLSGQAIQITVDSNIVAQSNGAFGAGGWCFVTGVIIPNGSTYSAAGAGGATLTTINSWELRTT